MHISMATCHYLQLYLWVSFSDHGGWVVKMGLHLSKLKKGKDATTAIITHSLSSSGSDLRLREACDYCC